MVQYHPGAGRKRTNCFDGKVLRGSGNGCVLNPLQLMCAMEVDSGLILYQQEVSDKTNEIPVMQAMLRQLSVKGAIITADLSDYERRGNTG
jgi:hypothetical protein